MAPESDNHAPSPLGNPPIAFDIPGEQPLCTLIKVVATPQGLIAVPDPAVVALDDMVLWFAEPGLGAFKIGLEVDDVLEVKVAGDGDAHAPAGFVARSARKDAAKGKGEPTHVWHSGVSHLVSARPVKRTMTEGLRYWLWKADGGAPGEAMMLLVSHPRRQAFGTSGTVRPEDAP